MSVLDLDQNDALALTFLARNGPHCVELVDDDPSFAAALTFVDLARRGLVTSTPGDDGPVWMISPIGQAALKRSRLQ